jgi:hypothetical protein
MNWKKLGYTMLMVSVAKVGGIVGFLIVCAIVGLIEFAVHAWSKQNAR